MGVGKKIVGAAKRVTTAYVWSITGDWRNVREQATQMRERLHLLRDRKYRIEQFDHAVARQGLDRQFIAHRYQQLTGMAALYGLIAVVAIAFLVAAPWSEHPFSHACLSLGVAGLAGSKYLVARFRADQIHAGELFGFWQWLTGRVTR